MLSNDGAPEVLLEWALWGRRPADSHPRVLACSGGDLKARDFARIVYRYQVGEPDHLPQYAVSWVPEPTSEPEQAAGDPDYVALATHERAPDATRQPTASDRRDTLAPQSDFTRLFCFRYAELAEYGVSYAGLAAAVRAYVRPSSPVTSGSADPAAPSGLLAAVPATVQLLGNSASPGPEPQVRELAETVAALLLTTRPICVLGAGEVTAADRLAFIDLVVSLLPYGLRAKFSASTWISPNVQEVKFRLFFSSVKLDDHGRTIHVRWGQRNADVVQAAAHDSVQQYLSWLHRTGGSAVYLLADQKTPLRFTSAEIGRMITVMPLDPSVDDSLEELSTGLHRDDATTVGQAVGRLRRYLGDQLGPADRAAFRQFVVRNGLLKDRLALNPSTRASVYRVLLRLAFDMPLTYAGYCEIEDAIGGMPRGTLRQVMLKLEFAGVLPLLLVVKAESRSDDQDLDQELVAILHDRGVPPTAPLDELEREAESVRPAHRSTIYDFAVRYVREYADNPSAELRRRGYLAGMLRFVFPGDSFAQQSRLVETLRLVYDGPLDRNQIRKLFRQVDVPPTAALEAAVVRLARWPDARQFVADEAARARLRTNLAGSELA
jgi:hypothetical protein